jgi:hypothetical protein
MLQSWCQPSDFTCQRDGEDVTSTARKLRTVNYLSGAALVGVYLWGVIDGFRRAPRERPIVVSGTPTDDGFMAGVSLRF